MSPRQLYHWDQVNMISLAFEEGKLEGLLEAKLERAHEVKVTIAKAMLDNGLDSSMILKTTGISREELVLLKAGRENPTKTSARRKKQPVK